MIVVYLFSAKLIAKILNCFLSSCRKSEKKDMAKVLGSSYLFELDINPAYMYKDVVLVPFEDTEFYILKNYDSVLSHIYGDYMTPPPETATEDDGTPSFLTRVAHPMEAYDPGSWLEVSENSRG